MADRDFNIKIVTSADLSGISDTEAALGRVADKARIASLPGRGFTGLGGAFGVGSASAEEILAPAAAAAAGDMAVQTEKVAINAGKARQEFLVLIREAVTGGNVMRTLGSLFGALGSQITIAAIAGIALFETIKNWSAEIKKAAQEQLAFNREIEKAVASYKDVSTVEEWGNRAEAVESRISELRDKRITASAKEKVVLTSQIASLEIQLEELDKAAKAGIERRAVEEQVKSEVQDQVEAMREAREEAAKADPSLAGRTKAKDDAKALVDQEERRIAALNKQKISDQERIANARILKDAAQDAAARVERTGSQMRSDDSDEAEAARLRIQDEKQQADAARQASDSAQKDAQQAKNDEEIINQELIRRKAILGELRSEYRQASNEVRTATAGASSQAQRVVANEQAAQKAREEGRLKDAQMFEKSAKAFESGIRTPAQRAELAALREQLGLTPHQATPPTPRIPTYPGFDFNPNTGEYVPKGQKGESQTTKGTTVDKVSSADAQALKDAATAMNKVSTYLNQWT
jgi:hypothetical protein